MTHERLAEIREQLLEAARDDVERLREALAVAERHLSRMESSQDGLTSSR